MRRTIGILATAGMLALGLAPSAQAVAPERDAFPFTDVIEAHVAECDRTIRWEIDGEATVTTFFDTEGNAIRQIIKITELNTVTDVDNDVTVREGPLAFTATLTFHDDGSQTTALSGVIMHVVHGEIRVADVGRYVVHFGDEPEILHSSGSRDLLSQHPFFLGSGVESLPAFCPVFA